VSESIVGIEAPALCGPRGALDRFCRATVLRRLESLADGELTLVEGDGRRRFGRAEAGLHATVYVRDAALWRALALRGALGGAEAYLDGAWRSDDLTAALRIFARNRETLEHLNGGVARLARPSLALFHALRRNTRRGSRRNIAGHYDLGNDFFELFLDPTLSYSAGIFEEPAATMEEASIAKLDRICRKLRLGPNDHVLEIGTGWGGFALHAAQRHGCRVTTTTISARQLERAREQVERAGLTDRVEILFEDYRELRGSYDKLVSVEMIEAVGHQHLGEFFRVCGERLRPDGAMLLQAITVADRDFEASTRSVDFIKRHVFPGGQLVSVAALCKAAARQSDLQLRHLEDFTPHYAETLRRWRERMDANREPIRGLGLDETFLRLWEYYLSYCEAGFEERQIGVVQALFERAGARGAPLLGHLA
jgi:cyclopropane-fatty-acyl-phospholipid synthase